MDETQIEALKHLRKVHFALVAASFTLMVASSLPPDIDLNQATTELKSVVELARSDGWEDLFIRDANTRLTQVFSDLPGINLEILEGEVERVELGRLDLSIPGIAVFFKEEPDAVLPVGYRPVNLDQFRLVWGSVGLPGIGLPDWSQTSFVDPTFEDLEISCGFEETRQEGSPPSGRLAEPLELLRCTSEGLDELKGGFVNRGQVSWNAKESRWELTRELQVMGHGSGGGRYGIMTTSLRRTQVSLREQLLDAQKYDLRPVRFERAVPALATVATGLGSLGFEDLELYIEEQKKEGRPSVSVFGASLPSQALTTWGPLALVIVQLYFLLHLWETAAVRRNAELFAWIGTYTNRTSRWTFLLSVSALPLLTVILLQLRSLRDEGLTLSWGRDSIAELLAAGTFWYFLAAIAASELLAIATHAAARAKG